MVDSAAVAVISFQFLHNVSEGQTSKMERLEEKRMEVPVWLVLWESLSQIGWEGIDENGKDWTVCCCWLFEYERCRWLCEICRMERNGWKDCVLLSIGRRRCIVGLTATLGCTRGTNKAKQFHVEGSNFQNRIKPAYSLYGSWESKPQKKPYFVNKFPILCIFSGAAAAPPRELVSTIGRHPVEPPRFSLTEKVEEIHLK